MLNPFKAFTNSLSVIAEAVLRVEHKLDVLLQIRLNDWKSAYPMANGTVCPICTTEVQYQMNISANVVTRKCGCGTKLSPMIFEDTATAQDTSQILTSLMSTTGGK
jgi:hypothetical protein